MKKGSKMSDEQKRKISEAHIGMRHSEDTKRKISSVQMGKHLSEEHRRHISDSLKLRGVSSAQIERCRQLGVAGRGRILSAETRMKISLIVSNKYLSGAHRKNSNLRYNGIFFRSSWEIKVAKWLDERGISWEYEAERFICDDGGVYIPDFKLGEKLFLEVKGYVSYRSSQKMDFFVRAGNRLIIVDNSNIDNICLDKVWKYGSQI